MFFVIPLIDWLERPPHWTRHAEFSPTATCPFCESAETGRQWEDMSSAFFCDAGVLWRAYARCRCCHQDWWTWQANPNETPVDASNLDSLSGTE